MRSRPFILSILIYMDHGQPTHMRFLHRPIEATKAMQEIFYRDAKKRRRREKTPSFRGHSVLTAKAMVPVNIPAFKAVKTYAEWNFNFCIEIGFNPFFNGPTYNKGRKKTSHRDKLFYKNYQSQRESTIKWNWFI